MSVHGNTFDCFSHFFSEEKFLKRLKDSFYRAIKFKFQVFWKCRLAYWVKRQCDGRWVWSAKRLKTIDQGHLVLLLCCGVKNMTPTKSRKRPLLVKSSAPPPRTATTIRLEQILEGNPKQNKKSRRNVKKSNKAAPTLSSTKENERWSTLVSLNNNDAESSNRTSRQNVLASKGGLANVPGFRKATMPVKKPIRKKKTKNTNRGKALPPTGGLKHDMNVSKSSSISDHQSIPVKNKQLAKEEEEDKTKLIDEQHEIVDLTSSSSLPDDIHHENQTQNTKNTTKTSSSSKVGLKLVHGKRNNRNKAVVRRPIASMETAAIPIPLTESKPSKELQLNPLLQELPPITKDTISTQVIPNKTFCLLYTSPSPRDLSTSRMPSSA